VGTIDWEWWVGKFQPIKQLKPICELADRAYTTTKEEAFAAPLAFIDVRAFYDGHNGACPQVIQRKYIDNLAGLSELEDTFTTAFESLERPDLAALVRGGKKYQRIPFVIGTDFSDLPILFLAFRQLVLGKNLKPTFEEWKKEAWDKYKAHPFLALKTMTWGAIEARSFSTWVTSGVEFESTNSSRISLSKNFPLRQSIVLDCQLVISVIWFGFS
jgi:hypothetical protein